MHKKIPLLLLLSTSLVISADHHAMKGDQSKKERKKIEMEKRGMWIPEDCKKISQSSGAYLYFSGEAFKKRSAIEKDGNKACLLYTSPSPRDATLSRMPSSA